jgi:hypothetical protein
VQVKTNVKGGGISMQHNEAQVRLAGLKVQTGVKAGDRCPGCGVNHNETQVRAVAPELRVQTSVRGGAVPSNPGGGGRPGLAVQTGVKAGAKVSKVDGLG